MSSTKVKDVLKKNGNVIHEKGEPLSKGGLNPKKIFKMSRKEWLEVSPYFEKSCQIGNKIKDSNFNNNEGVKIVNAFYIYGPFQCGSFHFI